MVLKLTYAVIVASAGVNVEVLLPTAAHIVKERQILNIESQLNLKQIHFFSKIL